MFCFKLIILSISLILHLFHFNLRMQLFIRFFWFPPLKRGGGERNEALAIFAAIKTSFYRNRNEAYDEQKRDKW